MYIRTRQVVATYAMFQMATKTKRVAVITPDIFQSIACIPISST